MRKFALNQYLETIEYFRQRYFIEQRRAERKGYEFLIIVIDLTFERQQYDSNVENPLLNKAEDIIFTTSKTLLRATDVVVKYFPYKIAILLPDTDLAGGQFAIERIKAMLNETDQSLSDLFQQIKIVSYSYPLQAEEINKFIHSQIIDDKNSASKLERAVERIKSYYSNIFNGNEAGLAGDESNFQFSTAHSLVIKNPFFLLSEVFNDTNLAWQKTLKRILDVVLSIVAIICFLPMMLIVAILIKLTSDGPIFFKQERIGYLGKKFTIFKFRTMYELKDEAIHKNYVKNFIHNTNLDEFGSNSHQKIYKLMNDYRITSIGRLLRRTSIDEIGQFINVLKGDMSLVGPRPPIPYEVELYDLWHKRRYLAMKPGITGLWQIQGRSTTTFNEMVRLDLAYINNWSLILDLKILARTILSVLSMRGAY